MVIKTSDCWLQLPDHARTSFLSVAVMPFASVTGVELVVVKRVEQEDEFDVYPGISLALSNCALALFVKISRQDIRNSCVNLWLVFFILLLLYYFFNFCSLIRLYSY